MQCLQPPEVLAEAAEPGEDVVLVKAVEELRSLNEVPPAQRVLVVEVEVDGAGVVGDRRVLAHLGVLERPGVNRPDLPARQYGPCRRVAVAQPLVDVRVVEAVEHPGDLLPVRLGERIRVTAVQLGNLVRLAAHEPAAAPGEVLRGVGELVGEQPRAALFTAGAGSSADDDVGAEGAGVAGRLASRVAFVHAHRREIGSGRLLDALAYRRGRRLAAGEASDGDRSSGLPATDCRCAPRGARLRAVRPGDPVGDLARFALERVALWADLHRPCRAEGPLRGPCDGERVGLALQRIVD